ncbi:MAG: DUF1592 domain-containing protein, partial [Myxococcales bacterium]|nr:DUF1592 domain-containing protein [Myxococcales bacterium]
MSHSSPPPTSSRERRSPRAALLAAALTLGASACVGAIGGDDGDGTSPTDKVPSTPTNFVCDDSLVPTSLPLRRLSLAQYRNTVGDLVRWLAPSDADSILTDVEPALASVPDDTRIGPDKHFAAYGRLDQAVQQAHVDATYGVAEAVGAAIAASPARLAAAAGDCAVDGDASNDEDCLAELIRAFGEQALRRPVTDEDVAFYAQPAGAAPFEAADYGDVIALLMTSPHMLYFVEHGRDEAGDKVALDGYELASRLSYHFWQTLPDEALFEAARSGELLTEAGYQAQVDRLFASPRTRDALGAFFREWLENTVLE